MNGNPHFYFQAGADMTEQRVNSSTPAMSFDFEDDLDQDYGLGVGDTGQCMQHRVQQRITAAALLSRHLLALTSCKKSD